MTATVALNARFQAHRVTGMQRYAAELAGRLAGRIELVRPKVPLAGAKGHLWEQLYLPMVVGKRLLWSPNNTGPLAVSRQVCTFHDLIPLDHPEWFNPRFADWYGWLLPRLARRLPRLIAVSEFTKSRIVELCKVPESKISVVPNGVDERFRPQPAGSIAAMRSALSLPEGDYYLYVGSLEPRKNLAALLRAWKKAGESLPGDVHLVIAGARGRSQIFAGTHEDPPPPRTFFTGYVADELLPSLYSGALAAVYPSLYEGFGLPPLEAMACGAPVITSNTTSISEVVGGAAVTVNPTSVDEIAEAMLAVAANSRLRSELREAGLARAARFSWERCAGDTWNLLRGLC